MENGIEKTPAVEYYTMGSGQWKTAGNWPLPDGEKVTFYLDGRAADTAAGNGSEAGHGILSLTAPEKECEDHFTYDPENPSTHIIDMSENELVPVAHAHDSVRQLHGTAVFVHIGDPHHQICIFAVGGETDHRLGVSGDGKFLLQNAGGVAEHIGPLLLVCVVFRNQFEHPEFMEPGRVYPVTIRTTKLSHTFQKGHQMRVTVTSSAKNFIFPNSNTRDGFNSQEIRLAHNCVHHGGRYLSAVTVTREREK